MRLEYATIREKDETKRAMFEGLTYVLYADFISAVRLPRYSDNTLKNYTSRVDDATANHIVYLAYRWIYKNPVSGKTANDDTNHTQFRRMLKALEEYLLSHPRVDPAKLGIWLVSTGAVVMFVQLD